MNWIEINTKEDIEKLKYDYFNFHDSCIISFSHVSGSYVNEENYMGIERSKNVFFIKFQSQMGGKVRGEDRKILELCFEGLVTLVHSLPEDLFCDIFECYLEFNNGNIIWSSDADFDLNKPFNYLSSNTTIIANKLKYRFIAN